MLPQPLLSLLRRGGVMVVPVGSANGMQVGVWVGRRDPSAGRLLLWLLVGWLVGRLVDWLVGVWVGRWVGRPVGCCYGFWSVSWLVG